LGKQFHRIWKIQPAHLLSYPKKIEKLAILELGFKESRKNIPPIG
jgi:hypothetical protein